MDHGPVRVTIHPGTLASQYNAELAGLVQGCFASRLSARDKRLFGDADDSVRIVARRLGWVNGATWLAEHAAELEEFATEILRDGFEHVLLLGMGGSSLCPEVLSQCRPLPEYLRSFEVVDSTDPGSITRIVTGKDLARTLVIVSSKSGSTVETQSQARFFLEQLSSLVPEPGRNFVAITDSGSSLAQMARDFGFRRVFLNPEDIGGRYSALSYFGMVPAALLEWPLESLGSGGQWMESCAREDDDANPVLMAGALLGAAARSGVDKLTFVASPATAPVVPWIEQLVAESTGKSGRGLVPIEAERAAELSTYGEDRLFCVLRLSSCATPLNRLHAGLVNSRRAWLEIECEDADALASLFLFWECVTAAAGRVLDINPFDEPNVKESKDKTLRQLEHFEASGRFNLPSAKASAARFEVASPTIAGIDVDCMLSSMLQGVAPGDYLAFLYFGDRTTAAEAALQSMRDAARAATGAATLRGYGPRYLHSIGQLYKGGAPSGHFVMLVSHGAADVGIPGASYSFGQLLTAQALGDYEALVERGRPCLWVRLSADAEEALLAFARAWNVACDRITVRA